MKGFKVSVVFVLLMLLVAMVATAQQATPQEPALDASTKEMIQFAMSLDQANSKTRQARLEAMLSTPQGQAFQQADTEMVKMRQEIQARVSAKVQGYELDFSNGKLVKAAPKK